MATDTAKMAWTETRVLPTTRVFSPYWRADYQWYGLCANRNLLNQQFEVIAIPAKGNHQPQLRVSAAYRDRHARWQEVIEGKLSPARARELHALLSEHVANLDAWEEQHARITENIVGPVVEPGAGADLGTGDLRG